MKMWNRLEDINEARGELMDRVEETRDELMQRAEDIKARFADQATQEKVTGFAGWTLVSAGLAWGMTDWMRGRRNMGSLVLPMALIAMGVAMLGGGSAWRHRAAAISEAEMAVREQLSSLGPLGRARVLRDMAAESAPLIRRIAHRN